MKVQFTLNVTRNELNAYKETVNNAITIINEATGTNESLIESAKIKYTIEAASAWQKFKYALRIKDELDLVISVEVEEDFTTEVLSLIENAVRWSAPVYTAMKALSNGISPEMKASVDKLNEMSKSCSRSSSYTRG